MMLTLRLTKSPTFANTEPSTAKTELPGLPLLVSNWANTNSIWLLRTVQRRKLMLTNSRLLLKLPRETAKDLKPVSEWTTKSTCLSSTTQRATPSSWEEKVVVAPALPELIPLLSLASGTKPLRCQMASTRTPETAMKWLWKWLSTWAHRDIDQPKIQGET